MTELLLSEMNTRKVRFTLARGELVLLVLLCIMLTHFNNVAKGDPIPRFGACNILNKIDPNVMKSLGPEINRAGIHWGKVEPVPGKYLITQEVLNFIGEVVPPGAEPLVGISTHNPWGNIGPWKNSDEFLKQFSVSPTFHPIKNYDDYRRFIMVLADSLKGKVKYYQILNEPDLIRPENNSRWWGGTAEELIKTVRITYEALKESDPDAYLIMGGFALPWDDNINRPVNEDFINTVVKGVRDYVDAFDIHHYREYNLLSPKIQYIKELGRKPIWITEMGAPSANRLREVWLKMQPFFKELEVNQSLLSSKMMQDTILTVVRQSDPGFIYLPENRSVLEKIKAEELVKLYAIAFEEGVSSAFWFQVLRDKMPVWYTKRPDKANARTLQSVDKRYRGSEQGLYDEESREPLPAFYTYSLLVQKLSGFTEAKFIGNERAQIYEFQFSAGNKKYVCWSDNGPIAYELKAVEGEYQATRTITDMDQTDPSTTKLSVHGGKLKLELDSTPIIIEATK